MHGSYRADHVGSLLRPDEVKAARASFNEGSLTSEALKEVEDRAVLASLERQKSIGVDIFTEANSGASAFRTTWWKLWTGLCPPALPPLFGSGMGPAENLRSRVPGRSWGPSYGRRGD